MGSEQPPAGVEPGDQYRHDDGTTEVVYAIEDGTVLTLREYPEVGGFRRAVDQATYLGVQLDVASLPPPTAGDDNTR